jgi:hypothetical protein
MADMHKHEAITRRPCLAGDMGLRCLGWDPSNGSRFKKPSRHNVNMAPKSRILDLEGLITCRIPCSDWPSLPPFSENIAKD